MWMEAAILGSARLSVLRHYGFCSLDVVGLFFLRVRPAMSELWTSEVFTEGKGLAEAFSGCLFPVSIGKGLIFSLDALLIKIHKPPCANLTAVLLFLNYFFLKTIVQKWQKRKKTAKTICKLVTTSLALGLLQREKPTLPQLNLF